MKIQGRYGMGDNGAHIFFSRLKSGIGLANVPGAGLLAAFFLIFVSAIQAQDFTFVTSGGTNTLTFCSNTNSDIVIPDNYNGLPVTAIRDSVFYGDSNLTSIALGTNLAAIGYYVFLDCANFKAITVSGQNTFLSSEDGVLFDKSKTTLLLYPVGRAGAYAIPKGVLTLGDHSFEGCENLSGVSIPNSVQNLEDSAFGECMGLTDILIPNSVTNVGEWAFSSCSNLTSVIFDRSAARIGTNAFEYCAGLTGVDLGTNITGINDFAFYWCWSLTNIIVPGSVGSIGANSFEFCSSLAHATIANGVTSIEGAAFAQCMNLTDVFLPASLTNVAQYAFYECYNLSSIILPENVPSVELDLFYNCVSLTNVVLGTNVVSIGDESFENCSSLTNFTIPARVLSIGDSAFNGCSDLSEIIIPDGATNLGSGAFVNCTNLTDVVIGNHISTINDMAFYNCSSLTNIVIPANVTSVEGFAFYGCNNLTNVYFEGDAPSGIVAGPFDVQTNIYLYYLPGTMGWSDLQLPTYPFYPIFTLVPWFQPAPLIVNNEPGFGLQNGGFGFTISWATNASVVVEACTNLGQPVWQPVQTNDLNAGIASFSDLQYTNFPARFYRLRQP